MTKQQMIDRIGESTRFAEESVKNTLDIIPDMVNVDNIALVHTLLTLTASITDTMNNLALILCEMWPCELSPCESQTKEDRDA